ncbi:MAG: DUF3488 and transglutaminase-like domain-containing protein [Bacteriovoracaceae bacterium]|nr:DUF3488 and transglutaminase-like domain-containing protein [Bacteriovoracaceae bacterium]
MSWFVFLFFLWEELTLISIVTVLLVIIIKISKFKVNKLFPKLLGFLVFGFVFLKFGFKVNPEMGLNLLLAVVSLKLLEAQESRDWRMLALGSFLVWATGSLFVKTPLYFIMALTGCALAIMVLIKNLGEDVKISWKDLGVWTLKSLPLAVLLFFFLPRFSAGIWSPPAPKIEGQVGFSDEARPGDISELKLSGEHAFHAKIHPIPLRDELYWRGATLSGHDGWNWFSLPKDENWIEFKNSARLASPAWWQQEIIHKKASSRAFGLDWPLWWEKNAKQGESIGSKTLKLPPYENIRRYKVISSSSFVSAILKDELKTNLISGVKKKIPPYFIQQKPASLIEAKKFLEDYFKREGFIYSLSPGKIARLEDFFKIKKGWCTHFASSSALVLRYWGFPTRLVSGYQGGEFNSQGEFFLVSENDAHVWLESWENGSWMRIDPTSWIAPNRIELNSNEFYDLANSEQSFSSKMMPLWMRDTQRWIDHMNFKFLVWSEEFDREAQSNWAHKLKWDLSLFYSAGFLLVIISVLGFWFYEYLKTKKIKTNELIRNELWLSFIENLKQKKVKVEIDMGPEQVRAILIQSEETFKRQLQFIDLWVLYIYKKDDLIGFLKVYKRA